MKYTPARRLLGVLMAGCLAASLCACDIVIMPPPAETTPPADSVTVDTAADTAADTTADTTPATPVTPAEGRLANAEFISGYTDSNGVAYGRLMGSYPLGEGITLQVLASAAEFDDFSCLSLEEYRRRDDEGDTFAAAMAGFDAAFFETHDLVVIRTSGGSGSLRFGVNTESADDKTQITLITRAPNAVTMDLVFWAVLVPVEKGTTPADVVVREVTERVL